MIDWLDPKGLWDYRLFREHCTFHNGVFVKDLSRLARPLKHTIIIDNSPASYMFHREWAIPTTSWYDDWTCTELYQLIPILECLSKVSDIRPFLKSFVKDDRVLFSKASQVLRGGKLGERTQSQQRINDESFSGKDKKQNYKKRTASERRHHKNSSNSNKVVTINQENYNTIKDQPRYSSVYKIEAKEAHSVKHNSTKLEKQTPRQQNKYHSRFENSTERNSKNGLNTSKTPWDKQCERNSSRKRERDNKRSTKIDRIICSNIIWFKFLT